jgi:acetyl-CoA C-acetyltransferase
MPEAVIVATARSPIGRAHKGSLTDVRIDDMGGFIVQTLMDKVPAVDTADIDDVIMGAANHAASRASTSPATSPCWPACPRRSRAPR